MDEKSFNIRVPKRWARVGMIVLVTALIVAPLTAIASHTFTDVPDSNTFHEDIAWLEASGVTKGCNPPANTEFCPDDFTTRGQMSAFMRRFAQYLGAEDGTPAQADNATTADSATTADNATTAGDADTVDGFHASDLISEEARGEGVTATVNQDTTDSPVTADILAITAPTDGGVLTTLSFNCGSFSGTTNTVWDVEITHNGAAVNTRGGLLYFAHADLSTDPFDSATSTAFVPVTAGVHDFGYTASDRTGDGSLDCDITMTAAFVTLDGTGVTPSAATSSGLSGGADG